MPVQYLGENRMSKNSAFVGSRAPDFALPCTENVRPGQNTISLQDYRDRWLTIVFYPRDFSLICPTELTALSDRSREFAERECDLLGISTDTVETHQRWIDTPRA